MSYTAIAISPPLSDSLWGTVRFRRAKDTKGWALLGIPQKLYPLVAFRLFELKARLISHHSIGPFVNVLFEASAKVAAKLACVFPAPPGCEALKISESGEEYSREKQPHLPLQLLRHLA